MDGIDAIVEISESRISRDHMKINSYPSSLVTRCEYLEKVNSCLRETIEHNEIMLDHLRNDIRRLHELLDDSDDNRVWIFQNDGYDNIGSMCNDLPVLIMACDLREILLKGEKLSEDFQE